MALHYNLSKVYAISDNDQDFAMQIISVFASEVPLDLEEIKEGIKAKDHSLVYSFAHKIKPTLDLLGMDAAFEEIIYIENWTKLKGKKKEIKETYKSLKKHINKALKEVKKDFNLQV
ncbi:histidine kinase [Flavobacterium sp. '19STA2R22 D10 B1']|uniref:histidine kinase n=1 Tax=Flavobacterium aerium TaxID=3037261 RepID=UPI00278C1FD5|nr:histidine kinase [Flavobacterium sp. '19STA2R22 D10 B1']